MSKKTPTTIEIATEIEQLNLKIVDLQSRLIELKSQTNVAIAPITFSELTSEQIIEAALSLATKKNEATQVAEQLETAIAQLQMVVQEKQNIVAAIALEERAKAGLQQVKATAKIAKTKLEEARGAIANLQAVADIVGQDCLQVNGRIPFENRIDKSTGFLVVSILDNCVVLEYSNAAP